MQVGGFLNPSLTRVSNERTNVQKTSQDSETVKQEDKLTSAQKAQVAKLQTIDQKVKEHEAAHIGAGGSVIKSGANFSYTKGPDNQLYATGGEVSIDTSSEATPEETIAKMQIIRAAALAPADPSGTDYKVASTASLLEMKARLELSQELKDELAQKNISQYANNEESEYNFA